MKMKNIAKFKITVIIQEDLEVLLIICDRRQKDKTITQWRNKKKKLKDKTKAKLHPVSTLVKLAYGCCCT